MQNGIRICYDVLQTIETDGVLAPWNPESKISASAVLFVQMRDCSCNMALAVKVGVMLEAELYRPSDDCLSVDHPVGLSHYHSVDAAGCAFSRCPVVFRCLCYHLDLFQGEPLSQSGVTANDDA